jgi:hypothetical protein
MLLQKLQGEADIAFQKEWKARNQKVVRLNAKHPPSKTEQSRARLFKLRKETREILTELELARQVEAENERYLEARLQQRKAKMTTDEKKAQAEETRRGQILFSRVVAENHPDWREQENPNAEVYRQQYTPTNGRSPKAR